MTRMENSNLVPLTYRQGTAAFREGITFLCGVEDLGEVPQRVVLVEDAVGLGEVVAVLPGSRGSHKTLIR